MANELENSKETSETNLRHGLAINAAIDSHILTAKAYPRDLKQCMQEVVDIVCIEEDIAAACYYSLPRDGKTITGASIRLAEICASVFGNIQAGTEFVSNNGKYIVVKGWCRDLEKNYSVETAVTKSIINKYNKPYSESMQATTIAAASAIALRNAIFKIVPQVFVEKAYRKAMDIAVGDKDKVKFEEKKRNVFNSLVNFKIPQDKVLSYFGRSNIDEITSDELKEIIGILTSIKDSFITADEVFIREYHTKSNEKIDTLNQKRFEEKRQKVFESLDKYGIDAMRVCLFFERGSILEITPVDLDTIIEVGKSLKEGSIAPEEAFHTIKFDERTGEILEDEESNIND